MIPTRTETARSEVLHYTVYSRSSRGQTNPAEAYAWKPEHSLVLQQSSEYLSACPRPWAPFSARQNKQIHGDNGTHYLV